MPPLPPHQNGTLRNYLIVWTSSLTELKGIVRADLKSFIRKSHCLVTTQRVFITSRHTSMTTFSLWMGNWWLKDVQMLDKGKHPRAYAIFLSSLLQELLSFLSLFLNGHAQEQLLRVCLVVQGQTLRAEGWAELFSRHLSGVSVGTHVLHHGPSHACLLHIDLDWGTVSPRV